MNSGLRAAPRPALAFASESAWANSQVNKKRRKKAGAKKPSARAQRKSARRIVKHPATPDGRYFVRGRLGVFPAMN